MKSPLLFLALVSSAFASTPVLVRPTAETITKLQNESPMAALEAPVQAATPAARPADKSIIRESVILHDGKNWTLVPRGAVIHLPESMKQRVDAKPVGTLLPFSDFLANNGSWLAVNEVTFDQAAGYESLPAAQYAGNDKIVVAVHHQGPISVRVDQELPALTQR